jgi:hypothetical protein
VQKTGTKKSHASVPLRLSKIAFLLKTPANEANGRNQSKLYVLTIAAVLLKSPDLPLLHML